MTSTLNRLMVVELSMAATVPGFLVGLHYAVQLSRPKWGLISDLENNRTKWINLGMLILGIGANLATLSLALFHSNPFLAMLLSILAYTLIGLGVGASGTSLLALMAKHTAERRRPAAAMITWLMMIFGIAMTAGVVGILLVPYSFELLLKIGTLKSWVQAGCLGSCFMLISIMLLGQINSSLPLELAVVGLGFFNGMFAVAAIGSMMSLAGSGSKRREGTRMGLWGAAQAIAAGFGGLLGTILVDLLQVADLSPVNAYGMVFSLEASLFALAALLASTSITFNKSYGKNIAIPGE